MPRYYSFAEKLAIEKQMAYDTVSANKMGYFINKEFALYFIRPRV
jgi:hypothetical protein